MREIRTSGSTRGSNGAGTAARCSLLYWFPFPDLGLEAIKYRSLDRKLFS